MKKIVLIFSLFFIVSCSPNDDLPEISTQIVNDEIILRQGEVIEYYLSPFYEGRTRITDQANHYAISEISYQSGINFKYKAKQNFVGKDYVEITETVTSMVSIAQSRKIYKLTITVLPEK